MLPGKNKLIRFHIFVGLLVVFCFHACAPTYRIVEFEILEPATVSLPVEVQDLIILNRAPLTLDVFDEEDVKGLNEAQLYVLDTLITNSMIRGLVRVLKQSPIESFHQPLVLEMRRLDTALLKDLYLTRREVESICREYGGDAILSLEYYTYNFEETDIKYNDDPSLSAVKYYESIPKVHWNIYIPGNPRPFDSYTMTDTLFFSEIENGIPVRYIRPVQVVQETFFESGRKYGSYLVPVWSRTDRPLFKNGDPALRRAIRMTNEGDWDSAYLLWEQLSVKEDSSMRCRALHNMAVYHELEDELETASTLVDRALKYDTLEVVRDYAEDLDVRLQNRKEIYKQVR